MIDVENVSPYCRDTFDLVINDNWIYNRDDYPSRWPDAGNGCDDGVDPEDAPPIKWIKTNYPLVASQPEVSEITATRYANDLLNGADMPPIAAIKCKDCVIVWNGHHRATAYRVAKSKKIKVRFWATFDLTLEQLRAAAELKGVN